MPPRKRITRAAGILLITAFFCGCATADVAVDRGATVRDSAGVQIVENHGPLWNGSNGWTIDTIPVTRIGDDDSDPHQQFTAIQLATRLSDGRIGVVVAGQLHWFDSAGAFIRSSGPRGDGPGEFRTIRRLYKQPGDTIVAEGTGSQAKLVTFAPDGSFVREHTRECERSTATPLKSCFVELLPDGSGLAATTDSSIPFSATYRPTQRLPGNVTTVGPGHTRSLNRLYIIPPSMGVMLPTAIETGIEYTDVPHSRDAATMVFHLFYSRRSHRVAGSTPLRIATARNPEYEILLWTPEGRLERIVRYAAGRRVPTHPEREDNIKSLRKQLEAEESPLSLAKVLEAAPAPDTVPAVFGLHFGSEGELLVHREGFFPSHRTNMYDVFDRDGRLLGSMRLPERARVLELGRDYILAVQLQADDVPHVVVYRLKR